MRVNVADWTDPVAVGAVMMPKKNYGCVSKNNTTIRIEGKDTVVRLHQTDIVRFNDDVIILKTGGWKTLTTKERMNAVARRFCLSFMVMQADGVWECGYNPDPGGYCHEPGTIVYDFEDNTLVINRNEYL